MAHGWDTIVHGLSRRTLQQTLSASSGDEDKEPQHDALVLAGLAGQKRLEEFRAMQVGNHGRHVLALAQSRIRVRVQARRLSFRTAMAASIATSPAPFLNPR